GDFTPGRHLKVRADGEDAPTKSEPYPFLGEDQDAARSVGRRHRVRVVPVGLLREALGVAENPKHCLGLHHDNDLLAQSAARDLLVDRKSTRLNSSHVKISYA